MTDDLATLYLLPLMLILGTYFYRRGRTQRKNMATREMAIADGMTTLMQDGVEKILQGKIDLKQVRAVCIK